MKLNIRAKLLLAFAAILLLSSAVNIYSLVQMEVLADLTTKIYNHPLQVTRAVLNANTGIIKMHRSMKEVVLVNKDAHIAAAHTQVHQDEQQVYQQFAIVQKWILGQEGVELIAQTVQIFRDWTPIREQVIALMKTEQTDQAVALTNGEEAQLVALLDSQMKELTQYAANKATGMYEHAQTTRTRVMTTTLTALISVIMLSALLGFFISVSIVKSVQIIKTLASQLVAGEFTSTVTNRAEIEQVIAYRDEMGEIGRAFDAVAHSFNSVINDLVQVSQGLAQGNLRILPNATYQGDFLQIKIALETALLDQHQVVEDIIQVSQGLAAGNLRVTPKVEYKGDFIQVKQALENSLSDLRQVIDDIVQVSQELAEGEQRVKAKAVYQGDFVQIKSALETASVKLAQATTENKAKDWLKTGQTQLNDQMKGEPDMIQLATRTISFLTTYIDGEIGLFYLLKNAQPNNDQPYLRRIASYAYTAGDHRPTEFPVGEGLVGQVAMDRKTLFLTQTPEECPHIIRSGLSDALPRHLLISPGCYENTVKCVIEIGSAHEQTELQRQFLEQAMPNIALAINTAQSRIRMQELLQQSQQQTEELQQQSEELQTQQEELQQINHQLQEQQEELHHKQEELQQHNEELQTQSEELQTQQEELRQSNDELEARTRELEQQKAEVQQKNIALEQTQAEMKKTRAVLETKAEELELASQYKSEFLANMSHELRTPLNSLLILAQLLAENNAGNLTEKQVEYAKTIHIAGSDLLALINDILDLSKVEAGKMAVNIENCRLTDLVNQFEQKFRPLADNKGLVFRITVASALPPIISTDEQRFQQIINNLLSNAFKFTTEGKIKLEIGRPSDKVSLSSFFQKGEREQPVSQTGELSSTGSPPFSPIRTGGNFLDPIKTIAFRVTDTGIGIPREQQQIIFEAFQQVDGTTSRRYGGTGLGLSISRQLTRLLGGELELHSEEGKGSTFTLYLPETYQPPELPNKTNSSNLEESSQWVSLRSTHPTATPLVEASEPIADDKTALKPDEKSLLIIEDDQTFSNILMELGQEKNFKCILAQDGRIGLQLAYEYQPNAILLDIGLPQINGWTVLEKLKEHPDTRHIPVHLLSAAEQNTVDATKKGAIGFLHKPVCMEQLSQVFKKIEHFLTNPIKNILVIVDAEVRQQQILQLVGGDNIQTTLAITTESALEHLQTTLFDCIILDMDIEQGSGLQLLTEMRKLEPNLCQTPVIIYAERDLSSDEEALLLQCAEQLPIKAVSSSEHLLDEATLFLHQIEAQLPDEKRNMLRIVHDKEAILANKKVLIVDDDVRNVFALATMLEEKNMEVIAGNNGYDALKLLEKHPDVAIILMDIMMPNMDGYEAMRQIRQQPGYHKLPIIALTAKAMKSDKTKCLEAGANDYLSKPVDSDKLISLMRVWLYR